MNKNLIFISIAGVGLVIVGGLFFVNSRSNDSVQNGSIQDESVQDVTTENQEAASLKTVSLDPKDWQEYRNEKFGFAIKYPGKIVEDIDQEEALGGHNAVLHFENLFPGNESLATAVRMGIVVTKGNYSDSDLSFQEYVSRQHDLYAGANDSFEGLKPITVDGLPGYSFKIKTREVPITFSTYYYIKITDSDLFEVSGWHDNGSLIDSEKIIDNVLSTFRILK